ncbi:MFS transporter [Streptomyces sp. NPDC000618]|uniref:MFS transporter n=1 Tax=Streptomyces sp. NPDC000618 TaxID=3154265 RepID=UPI0033187212
MRAAPKYAGSGDVRVGHAADRDRRRALQGVGAAVLAPSALSLLTRSFAEGRARDRARADYSAAAGLGAALGLVVGGLVADLISWRAGFFLNVPVGIAMVMLALFVLVELWAVQPIVPLRLFASGERSGAYVTRMLYMGVMIGFFFFTAQFVQSVYHWTPLQAGLSFLPMTLVDFVLAVQVPRLLERASRPQVLTTGLALTMVGMAWLSRLDLHTPYLTGVALPMVLIGAGQGQVLAPLTSSGVDGVAAADAGAASGLVNTVHQIGSALSLSILTAVAASVSTSQAAADIAARSGAALTGSAVLLALALAATLTLILPARTRPHERSL